MARPTSATTKPASHASGDPKPFFAGETRTGTAIARWSLARVTRLNGFGSL